MTSAFTFTPMSTVSPKKSTLVVRSASSTTSSNSRTSRGGGCCCRCLRGPRVVLNGPPMNITNGIYQIGFTMSKFQMAVNMTEMENFRPGFFEMKFQRIGFYTDGGVVDDASSVESVDSTSIDSGSKVQQSTSSSTSSCSLSTMVETISKQKQNQQRPIILKLLLPILQLLFSEKASRRKVAMKYLTQERNMTRLQAIQWSMKLRSTRARSRSVYSIPTTISFWNTIRMISADSLRWLFFKSMFLIFFYPIRTIRRSVMFLKKRLDSVSLNGGVGGGDDAKVSAGSAAS